MPYQSSGFWPKIERQCCGHLLPPYSPCDFWLFPTLKSELKGTHFESVEAVKTKSTEVLKALQEKDFQRCFNRWKVRMECSIKREGEYVEGEKC